MKFTIVAYDSYGGHICSHFVSVVEAETPIEAKDVFLARKECDARRYQVAAVFAGEQKELLGTFSNETRYLGRYEPKDKDYEPY